MQHACCMLPWNAATRPSIVCLSCRGVMITRPLPPLCAATKALVRPYACKCVLPA